VGYVPFMDFSAKIQADPSFIGYLQRDRR